MKYQGRGVRLCLAVVALAQLSRALPLKATIVSESHEATVAQHHEGAVASRGATAFLATQTKHHSTHGLPRHTQLHQEAKAVRSEEEPEAADEEEQTDSKDEDNADENAEAADDTGDKKDGAKAKEKKPEHLDTAADDKADAKEEADDKNDDKDDDTSDDQEEPSTSIDPNPPVPPAVPAMYSPAPASADVSEDPAQDPVVAIITISNMDYHKMAKDQRLHAKVEAAIREAIAAAAGDDIDTDDVSLVSWSGSVRARTVIKPIEGVNSDSVVAELTKASDRIGASITENVGKLKGIKIVRNGVIKTDVDVLVATMTSSVSKVMSRAKAQGHLGRVYDLEKKASDARKRIQEYEAKEVKLDKKISEIENEEAFDEMVDARVTKVKGELQAPVFAETIGDIWKELRMFGTPCLLKFLRKEREDVAVEIKEAEGNATTVEEQLQSARDDVTDAWYPPPKKSSGVMPWYSSACSLIVIALFFN